MVEFHKAPFTAIYTDIGRGHPNYLDSVLRYLARHHPDESRRVQVRSVFTVARGLSRRCWQMVAGVYRQGSRGGIVSRLYSRLRAGHAEYNPRSPLIRMLRRDLLEYVRDYAGICLVAHPLLAHMLQDRHRVFYLHGEIAAPPESAVRGAERIFVPLPETREKMVNMGIPPEALRETGLVLEPEISGDLDAVVRQRLARLDSEQPLTIGFFISGAYPRWHVKLIREGVRSCYRAGMRIRAFWGTNVREVRGFVHALREFSDDVAVDTPEAKMRADANIIVVTATSREAETIRSMKYLPDLDLFCAAPHERVSWAVGAGLPQVMIGTPIGTFAPENRAFVLNAGCGWELCGEEQFSRLGQEVVALRQQGRLREMVEAGRKITTISGTRVIVEDLLAESA